MEHKKISKFYYRITQAASFVVSKFIFKRKFLRNEIKGKEGPFAIIANHQAALDFVNLIGATGKPMSFVISNSFYQTLPVGWIMDKIGVIPKQQFQTTLKDIKRMKQVIEDKGILVIYPAGLMCEDGLSTPIPEATYKFLQWIKADIYVAKTVGTYFSMPKWGKGMRRGRTFLDIYKLFTKEELAEADIAEIKAKADEALLFDAYREQDELKIKFKNNDNIEGLENVLYSCPHCKSEFTVDVKDKSTLYCSACGYAETADEYGMLHNTGGVGEEIRYVSDWSTLMQQELEEKVVSGEITEVTEELEVCTVDAKTHKFIPRGEGNVRVTDKHIYFTATVDGEPVELELPTACFPSVPFGPGKYVELQHGDEIYRCMLKNGKRTTRLVNFIKIFHKLNIHTHDGTECGCHAHV